MNKELLVSSLFVFELILKNLFNFTLYLFSHVLMIIPESMRQNSYLGLLAVALSCFLFGLWIETKYPSILSESTIKLISKYMTSIQFIFGLIYLTPTLYHIYESGRSTSTLIAISLIFILITSLLHYTITRRCLSWGVNWRCKRGINPNNTRLNKMTN